MRKCRLLAVTICLIFFVSGFVQASDEGSFFFSTGFHKGFFDDPLRLISEIRVIEYNLATISPNWQTSLGPGNISFGLELGYSSGSRFGGSGSVDFLPLTFRTSYALPLAEFFYIGPVIKVGGFGMLGPDWTRWTLFAGGRLEAEIHLPILPAGIYVAGGFDAYPAALEPVVVPSVEVGLRFPRGQNRRAERRVRVREERPVIAQVVQEEAPEEEEEIVVVLEPPPPEQPQEPVTVVQEPIEEVPAELVEEPMPQELVQQPTLLPTEPPEQPQEPVTVVQEPVEEVPAELVEEPMPQEQVQQPTLLPTEPPPEQPQEPVTVVQEPTRQEERPIVIRPDPGASRPVIYFQPDTAVMLERSRSTLDEVGRQMAADPSLRLLMFAYAAPFKSTDGRFMVSVNRGRFSRDYLIRQYGIAPSRIDFEAWGSERRPELARDGQWETFRCVEFALFASGTPRPSINDTS